MTRVNINVPDDLHKHAKAACALKGTTLAKYIISTISAELRKK